MNKYLDNYGVYCIMTISKFIYKICRYFGKIPIFLTLMKG